MNDTIIAFLKSSAVARISYRGHSWVVWHDERKQWAVYTLRNDADDSGELVYLTDDINNALSAIYRARQMPAMEVKP